MWLNLELVATALLGWLIFRDHLGFSGWIGLLGIVGAGVILAADEGQAGLAAGLLAAGACLCWGFDNHLTALIDNITPTQSTFWKALVAGSVNILLGLAVGGSFGNATTIAGSLVVGAFAVGISIALYISAAQSLGATRGQMLFASAPFFGLMLSVVLLGETISILQIIATILMAGSLLILFRERHSHYHLHQAAVHEHWHRHDDGHHDHQHEGLPAETGHTHLHSHETIAHTHPHWPDLHHRHDHDNRQQD
jgi:drug/metabolite transporter (DMT)-like permease